MGRSSLLAPCPEGGCGADVGAAAAAQWGWGGSVPTPQLLCVPAPPAGGQPGGFPPASCFTVSRASPPKAPQLSCLPPSPAGILGAYLPSSPPRAAKIPRVPRDPLCSASLRPRGAALAGCGGPCVNVLLENVRGAYGVCSLPPRERGKKQLSSRLGVQEELVWESQMPACFYFPGWGCLP